MAARTGLRQQELASLVWGDINLDSETPTFRNRASTSKNKKETLLPLMPEVASMLRSLSPGKVRLNSPVFDQRVPRAEHMRKDLERLGIPYRDEMGRYADFHSLRMTFSTFLQRNGVPIHVAKILMRHSDIRMTTQTYLDEHLLPLRESVAKLPRLSDLGPGSRIESQISVANGHLASRSVAEKEEIESRKNIGTKDDCHVLSSCDTSKHLERVEGIEPS